MSDSASKVGIIALTPSGYTIHLLRNASGWHITFVGLDMRLSMLGSPVEMI